MPDNAYKLEMRAIRKQFNENVVLNGVDFQLKKGEIHALIGENGAGKSTLMNILGGVLQADGGEILLDGKTVHFADPKAALDAGIAFIHQELNLVNDLAIYENMFIGRELKKGRFLDAAEMCSRSAEVFERIGISINPKSMVRDLDASYKQIVEIARSLLHNAQVIIMDEPTTSLTEIEIERVFEMMRTLSAQGVSIVFISHKLKEVLSVCDHYTVLRDGEMVAHGSTADTTTEELARYMVGHDVRKEKLRTAGKIGDVMMQAKDVTNEPYFRNVSFEVHSGEILGVTGLLGDGRSELFQTLFGALGRYQGTLEVEGKPVSITDTTKAYRLGIGYVPRNRKENGIVKDLSILENGSLVTLQNRKKGLLMDGSKITEEFETQKKNLRIKMGTNKDLITSLSGGNQQKVVLAKWLSANPKVLIFDNPTQGVDVGAKEEIYDIILKLADEGVAIIVLSSEAQEIIRLCDRTLIMYHGTVVGELVGDEMNEQVMMHMATSGEMSSANHVREGQRNS